MKEKRPGEAIDLADIFPFSALPGASVAQINSALMKEMALQKPKISTTELEKILADHFQYLKDCGGSGRFQTFLAGGLVVGVYTKHCQTKGKQADFTSFTIDLPMNGMVLPHTNFLGIIAENINWKNSDLNNSLFTDCYLQNGNFESAKLMYCDFSRSDMRNCIFRNADLQFADFENCNLEGADFSGAKLQNSRFPGANLRNIIY